MQRSAWRDIALAALFAAIARVLGAALVYSLGFRAVSDDDFARVVIAQRFAAAPKLDPTGTSWLPLPFWTMGGAMRVLGSTIEIARGLSIAAAALAGGLVAGVAVAAGMKRHRAIAAGVVAATMPWGMQLAVATVPEVTAACCAAAGAIALMSISPAVRLVGAFAILASTLSRYDAWPLAAAFATFTLFDARRDRRLIAAGVVAVLGPVAWSLWQLVNYGDAFRYLRLVRSYRRALGGGPSLLARFVGYPYGVVEEMREALAAGLLGAGSAVALERRGRRTELDWRRPLWLALLQLIVLIAGDVRDGAPTHHPERALLGPATIVIFAAGDAIFEWLEDTRSNTKRIVFCAVSFLLLYGYIALRLHRSLRWYAAAPRPRELAAGRALSTLPPDARVLIDTRDLPGGALDYGYYAVLAAFGRPTLAEVDRDQDPRKPRGASSFEDVDRLLARARAARATAALVWGDERARIVEAAGGHSLTEESPAPVADPRWRIMLLGRVP
jgi:hypothetical protein